MTQTQPLDQLELELYTQTMNSSGIMDNGQWSVPTTAIPNPWVYTTDHTVHITGTPNQTSQHITASDIILDSKSLLTMLEKISERLNILERNLELEDRWVKLKKLGEKYRKLEQELLEGEQVMDILKK